MSRNCSKVVLVDWLHQSVRRIRCTRASLRCNKEVDPKGAVHIFRNDTDPLHSTGCTCLVLYLTHLLFGYSISNLQFRKQTKGVIMWRQSSAFCNPSREKASLIIIKSGLDMGSAGWYSVRSLLSSHLWSESKRLYNVAYFFWLLN